MKLQNTFNLDSHKTSGKLYFMSDTHYNHQNVIAFGSRPFENVQEMNKQILDTLYDTLKPEDTLITLGDDFWCVKAPDICRIIDSLPTKNLYKIMGNHDKYGYYMNGGPVGKRYKVLADLLDITVTKDSKTYSVSLCHYPIYDFNHMYRGGIHLFGHVHGSLDEELKTNPRLMVDVGYDGALAKRVGSFLISFEDILDYFYEKTGGLSFDAWGRQNYKSSVRGYNNEDGEVSS